MGAYWEKMRINNFTEEIMETGKSNYSHHFEPL